MVTKKSAAKSRPVSKKVAGTDDLDLVEQRLAEMQPVVTSILSGDFSKNLDLPDKRDAFSDIMIATQTMQEVIRGQQREIHDLNKQLRAKSSDHSRALEEAQALTHLGSWEWDIKANSISWSDELYRIYGMRPQERSIDFEEFIELIHPEDREQVKGIIYEAFQSGEPFEFEHRIILPNGNERILKGMGKQTKDADGSPERMLGTSQDVTLAKQLERAKDEFISLVSHQLRTPLTIIRIHGNLLEDGIAGKLDPRQETHIKTMTDASIRLISLVDDILSISRVTLNRIKVNAKPTDPNKLIHAGIEEVQPSAEKKGAKIIFDPDKTLGKVPIDMVIFGEILRNLVGNAVRYSKTEGGEVTISLVKENDEYLLAVKDNGIGIPVSEQPFIFERFYRANNATAVDSEGSGLGLYIVKLFTEAAGGRVWFESTEKKGTAFYVAFPGKGMQQTHKTEDVR